MKIQIPVLNQEMIEDVVVNKESNLVVDIDTSIYSEERWEQNFPNLAKHEGLFQYIERVQNNSLTDRVKVAGMLKAIFCFIESDRISSYKEFAQMFNLAVPEYTEKLIDTLLKSFKMIINGSSVKN